MAEIGPTETLTNVWTLCKEAMTLLDMTSLQERLDGNGIVDIQLQAPPAHRQEAILRGLERGSPALQIEP